MFFLEYFGLTVMGIAGLICFAALAARKVLDNRRDAEIVRQRGYDVDITKIKLMDPYPAKYQIWKNVLDGSKVKIVSKGMRQVGKDSWITVVNYVKEGEEQLFSTPEELFMNQYTFR